MTKRKDRLNNELDRLIEDNLLHPSLKKRILDSFDPPPPSDSDSTKLQSYRKFQEGAASRCQAKIMELLWDENKPLSRRYISNKTGITINTTSGVIHQMLRDGDLIRAGKAFDEETHRLVELVEAAYKRPESDHLEASLDNKLRVAEPFKNVGDK